MDYLTKQEFREGLDNFRVEFKAELKAELKEEFESLARMVSKGFEDIARRLDQQDVRDKVKELDRRVTKVENALNITS